MNIDQIKVARQPILQIYNFGKIINFYCTILRKNFDERKRNSMDKIDKKRIPDLMSVTSIPGLLKLSLYVCLARRFRNLPRLRMTLFFLSRYALQKKSVILSLDEFL